MSKTTMLGEAQITPSPHDVVTVELGERDGSPAVVKITWPLQPTVIDPKKFGDAAAALVKLFSSAHVELARLRARRL